MFPFPLLAVALGIAAAVLFCATPTRWFTFDTVAYAMSVRRYEMSGDPGWLFHPHHLLFNGASHLAYRMLGWFRPDVLTIDGVQRFTALMGGVGVAAFALWMYAETRCKLVSLLGAVAFGGTFGWWFAASDGRATVGATAFVLLSCAALRRARDGRAELWAAAAGALLGVGILIHEAHTLFVPVALLAALLVPADSGWHRLRRVGLLIAALVVTVAVPYGIVVFGVKGIRSRAEGVYWLSTYARQGTWWNFDVRANLPRDVAALHKWFTGVEIGSPKATLPLALWGALLALALVGIRRKFAAVPVVAFVIYTAFFTVWDPGYFVHWMVQGGFVIALLALGWHGARQRGRWVKYVATPLVLAIPYVTWTNVMAVKTDGDTNPHLALAKRVAAIADRRGIVILSGMGGAAESEVYIPYFARMQVVAMHVEWAQNNGSTRGATAEIRSLIDRVARRGNAVYLLSEVTDDPGSLNAMRKRYGVKPEEIRAVFAPYQKTVVDRKGYVVIYRLTLPHPQ